MRDRVAVILLCFGVILGVPRGAAAEKVKTNQEAKLFSRPGEQAPVILEIPSGQAMTVVSRDGRWIKVRVKGRTGYVPRSKVDEPEGEQVVRNTRRRAFVDGRGTDRGFNGGAGPDDRVGADAVGDGSEPAPDDTKPPSKTTKGSKPAASDDDDGDDDSGSGNGKGKPPKAAAKPPVKPVKGSKPAASDDDDGDDDSGSGSGKGKSPKAAAKPPVKPVKGSKPAASDDDDGDDDSGSDSGSGKGKPPKQAAKPPVKPPPPPKTTKSGHDDDDGDDDDGGKGSKGGKASKPAPKAADNDDDNEKPDKRPIGHVRENTTVHDDPKASSSEAFIAHPKDQLFVGDVSGNYTFVETDEGDAGYVLTSKLAVRSPTISGRQINVDVRLGATIIGQTERGKGSTDTAHDDISLTSTTATISLGGEFLYPLKNHVVLGVEAGYDYGRSVVSLGKAPFTLHEINLRAEAGYDLHDRRGVLIYARLGVHDEIFHVDGVAALMTENTAHVPSESYFAPTVGVMLDVRHLTSHISFRGHLDGVAFGSLISQTKNLEDGATPTGQSVFIGAQLGYHTRLFELQLAYELNYGLYDFGPPLTDSQRDHTAADTDTTRIDIYHTVTIGVGKTF